MMLTVFKKELKHIFTTLHGILTLSLLLLCNGITLTVFNLAYGTASLPQTESILAAAYCFLLPLLACNAVARERKSGTEAFLFSLPLSNTDIVLGKFFALTVSLALAFIPLWITPVLFSMFGTVSIGTLCVQLLGFFLLALFLLTVCYFLAALTKSPLISYALGLGAMLVLYFSPFLIKYISNDFLVLEPFHRTAGFSYGHLDLASTLYFILGIALCLVISVCVMARRRQGLPHPSAAAWKNFFAKDTLLCLALCAAVLAINIGASYLPKKLTKLPVASQEAFDISADTEQVLQGLSQDVTISFLCNGGIHAADSELYAFLCDYADTSDRITLRVIDPTRQEDALREYGDLSSLQDMSVIVQTNTRYRVINNTSLYYYKNSTLGNYRITPDEYTYYCNYLGQYDTTQLYSFVSNTASYFDGESVLTNAVRYCLQERVPVICYDASAPSSLPDEHLLNQWELNGCDTVALKELSSIPAACDLLLLSTPDKDLTDAQKTAIEAYLTSGGTLLLTTDYTNAASLTNLQALLASYGMSAPTEKHIVCEGQASYCYQNMPNLFYAHINSDSTLTGSFNSLFLVPNAHAITLTDTADITHTSWLYTSASSYIADLSTGKALSEERASYTVGALAQSKNGGSILWISSPYAIFSEADSYTSGGNFTLLTNAVNALTAHPHSALSIPASALELSRITVTNQALSLCALLLCAVLPFTALILGSVKIYLRKKK